MIILYFFAADRKTVLRARAAAPEGEKKSALLIREAYFMPGRAFHMRSVFHPSDRTDFIEKAPFVNRQKRLFLR